MRRPNLVSAKKSNRSRLSKKGPAKRICGRLRRHSSPRLPIARAEVAPNTQRVPAVTEGAKTHNAEAAAAEPVCCGFGAVRVGALLGRLRLHLQTDRFLAVHRGDTTWERGCTGAALELADIVVGMQGAGAELDASLPPQHAQDGGALARQAPPLPGSIRGSGHGNHSESISASAEGAR